MAPQRRRGYVGVGSNIDPGKNVPAALALLRDRVEVLGASTFYRTLPVARPEQPRFTNGVIAIATDLAPRQVKQVLSGVEAKLGRVRTPDRHAPRTMDLDLLILGDLVLDDERLRLPDPDIRRRPFIALPLYELAPELILPDTRESLSEVVSGMAAEGLEVDAELTALLRKRISGSSESS